jgi:glycosyltransferase involved in cell wall biosynthesis
MKVLLAADFYPPAPGGLEAHVHRLGHALVGAGHQVTVVTGGGVPGEQSVPFDDDGVIVYRVGTSLMRLPGAYREAGHAFHPAWTDHSFRQSLTNALDRLDPDIVHAHGWCEFSAAAACSGRWPVVVTLHDYGLRCPKKNLLRGTDECVPGRGLRCVGCSGAEQATAKRAVLSYALGRTVPSLGRRVARFLAVSEHVAQRHAGIASGAHAITVVPNFVDIAPQPFHEPISSDVLYVGPADRHKGLHILLQAMRQLPTGLARLVVVGSPGVEDGVEFTGRLTGDALWRRFRESSLLVVPSIWPEPCPTVVLEALAWGRPVIASQTGGLPDLVAHGRTGLLVPPGDPTALAGALTTLLTDRPLLQTMARAAWKSSGSFGAAVVVARIEAVYSQVRDEWASR